MGPTWGECGEYRASRYESKPSRETHRVAAEQMKSGGAENSDAKRPLRDAAANLDAPTRPCLGARRLRGNPESRPRRASSERAGRYNDR